jgi:hypothetical protein
MTRDYLPQRSQQPNGLAATTYLKFRSVVSMLNQGHSGVRLSVEKLLGMRAF